MTVTVVWEQKNFTKTADNFSFGSEFPDEKFPPLFFAELSHGLVFETDAETVWELYFTDFKFFSDTIVFIAPNNFLACNISNYTDLVIKIVEPVDVALPDCINPKLTSLDQSFFASIFYKDETGKVQPLKVIQSNVSMLYEHIKSTLISNNLGEFCITMGIKDKPNEIPLLVPARKFIKKQLELPNLREIIVIIVSSRKELSFIYDEKVISINSSPTLIHPIIIEAAKVLNQDTSKTLNTICRRIITCCLNGGLPIELFTLYKKLTGRELYDLSSLIVDMDHIDLEVSEHDIESMEKDLEQGMHNFENHLLKDSSEAQYRSLFWDGIISSLFFIRDKAKQQNEDQNVCSIPYRLQSEWPTQEMFPDLEDRRVDFVAIFTSLHLLLLLVEAGKETFGIGINSHKDFSKLLGIMSKSCTKMAIELEKAGKKAENALVIGSWIGGHQIHFVMAKPVIKKVGKLHEVHCVLSFPEEWKFDLLVADDKSQLESSSENEILTMTDIPIEVQIENQCEMECRDEDKDIEMDKEYPEILIDDFVLNDESDSEETKFASYLKRNIVEEKLIKDNLIDLKSLCKVKKFIDFVYNYIDFINSPLSNRDGNTIPRQFLDPSAGGVFCASRSSSTSQTPGRRQTVEAWVGASSKRTHLSGTTTASSGESQIPEGSVVISKVAENELKIYEEHLSLIPSVFPELFNSKKDRSDPKLIFFTFEYMEPFIYRFDGSVNDNLLFSGLRDGLKKYLKFFLELSHCLHVLHEKFGLVHSDISPQNIMYSGKHGIWKLNDFDQALPLKESIQIPRTSGTEGFIAPESLENSLFTFESDIYALGQVFLKIPYFALLNYVMNHEGDFEKNSELLDVFYKLEAAIMAMTKERPEERISLKSLIITFMGLIKRIAEPAELIDNIPIFRRLELICESFIKEAEQSIESIPKVEKNLNEPLKVYEQEYHEKLEIQKTSKI